MASGFDLCIKCNKSGGKRLICSNDECPIIVHEKCMGVVGVVEGKFECPYCVSRKAYVELNQARKDVRLRKMELSLFVDARVIEKEVAGCGKMKRKFVVVESQNENEENSDHFEGGKERGEGELLREQDDVARNREGNGSEGRDLVDKVNGKGDDVVGLRGSSLVEEKKKGEGENDDIEALDVSENREKCNDKTASANGNDSIVGIGIGADGEGDTSKKMSEEHDPGLEKRKRKRLVRTSKLPSSNGECSSGRSLRSDKNPLKFKQNVGPSKVNSPSEPSSPKADHSRGSLPTTRKSPRKANKTKSTGEVSQKVPNHGGRKRIPWTDEEIKMIEKGVRQHGFDDSKNIPWRIILQHGRHIFNNARRPEHLKDKWRKMLEKENPAEES